MCVIFASLLLLAPTHQETPKKSTPPDRQRTTKHDKPEKMFSGPQVGERFPALKVRLLNEQEPEELVESHEGKPVQIFFLHNVSRIAFAVIRPIAQFGSRHAKTKNLRTILVFLTDDPPALEKQMKAIAGYLPKDVLVGVSPDGSNGPGPYGLNRNAMLTVLLGKDDKVTSNFAMGQPSFQVDGPKIAAGLAKLLNVKAPDFTRDTANRNRMRMTPDPKLEGMLRPLLQIESDDEAVKQIAEIEKYVGKDRLKKNQLGAFAMKLDGRQMKAEIKNSKVREKINDWKKLSRGNRGRPQNNQDPMIRVLFQPFLARDADEDSVKAAAGKVLDYAKKNPKTKRQIGEICRRIIKADRLENYGTAKAQEFMRQWARDFR